MFDPSAPYRYSIDVAARQYQNVSSQEKMTQIVENSIIKFYSELGLEIYMGQRDGDYGMRIVNYHTAEQDIEVIFDQSDNISGFNLNMYQPYSEKLLKDAYYSHMMFGAPIFTMLWLTDINVATMTIMSREDYLKMARPEARMLQKRMDYLDGLISQYGGWD